MPSVVLQIEKNSHVLHIKTIEDMQITKQNIEQSVFEATGLSYDQYDVHYVDAENDLIMTVVEQDYSIAQMTLEADTIVFHIEVKVDEEMLKLQVEGQIGQAQDRLSGSFFQSSESEEEKVEEVYKSAISSENQQDLQRKVEEELQNVEQIKKQPLLKDLSQQPLSQVNKQQMVVEEVIEQQSDNKKVAEVNKPQQNQGLDMIKLSNQDALYSKKQIQQSQAKVHQNYGLGEISIDESRRIQKLLQQPELCDRLFEQIYLRLQNVLKPQCFLSKSNTKQVAKSQTEDGNCQICKKQTKIPFYLNNRGQCICQSCEVAYQSNQILLKVRSEASKADLLAAKFVSLSKAELSNQDQQYVQKQSDPKQRKSRIQELLIEKLIRYSKQ